MLVLGIETSCDETALALVEDGQKVLATQVASSLKWHQPYGGVVPEIASRAHVELLTVELEALLTSARICPSQLDRIAVTYGPGLSGSLTVGLAAAKALGLAWDKPVVGVHHLQAHLYAALMERPSWSRTESMVGLVISGGHTALVRMDGIHRYRLLGSTRDDAVGEAFDKVAKLLGLGFPGGPEIERVEKSGNSKAFRFSSPRMRSGSAYDFSLSGVKTAVLYKLRELAPREVSESLRGEFLREDKTSRAHKLRDSQTQKLIPPELIADMAASFQSFIVEEVVRKSIAACYSLRIPRLVVGGGVVANRALRERLTEVCQECRIQVAIPPMGLCTDNGAMVAGLGYHLRPMPSVELTAVPDLDLN